MEPFGSAHRPLRLPTRAVYRLGYAIGLMRDAFQGHRTLKATVEALSAAAELRDPYTAGHQRRVAELSKAMCKHLCLDAHTTEGVWFAGIMHDIGKLGVPIEILTTIAPLSDVQYAIIRVHPEYGHGIIRGIDFPWPVPTWVRQHHERLDGSGYPDGRRSSEILLGSRIIAVADVYESMAIDRPYRRTKGHDSAITEIRTNSSRLYDPDVVDACVAVMEESNFKFFDNIRPVLQPHPRLAR